MTSTQEPITSDHQLMTSTQEPITSDHQLMTSTQEPIASAQKLVQLPIAQEFVKGIIPADWNACPLIFDPVDGTFWVSLLTEQDDSVGRFTMKFIRRSFKTTIEVCPNSLQFLCKAMIARIVNYSQSHCGPVVVEYTATVWQYCNLSTGKVIYNTLGPHDSSYVKQQNCRMG